MALRAAGPLLRVVSSWRRRGRCQVEVPGWVSGRGTRAALRPLSAASPRQVIDRYKMAWRALCLRGVAAGISSPATTDKATGGVRLFVGTPMFPETPAFTGLPLFVRTPQQSDRTENHAVTVQSITHHSKSPGCQESGLPRVQAPKSPGSQESRLPRIHHPRIQAAQ